MHSISWDKVFPGETPGHGATEAELHEFIASLARPVTDKEVQTIAADELDATPDTNPPQPSSSATDPRTWHFPTKPLPASYLSFLKWSNGGSFFNGKRGFNFLSTTTLRQFALSYRFPERMPGSLPFAFDGGDNFYLFDMRGEPVDGEYPILFVYGHDPSYDKAVHVADSFVEACEGKTDPAKQLAE